MSNFDEWGRILERASKSPFPEGHHDGVHREPDPPECNEICMTASDIGLPEYGDMIAYPHPECPVHGTSEDWDPS